jgi:hypothetical protein
MQLKNNPQKMKSARGGVKPSAREFTRQTEPVSAAGNIRKSGGD